MASAGPPGPTCEAFPDDTVLVRSLARRAVLDLAVPRTLAAVEAGLAALGNGRDGVVDAPPVWLFEPASSRRAAEARLAARGVRASFRPAYKPLVHAFLEAIDLGDAVRVEVRYPVVPGTPRTRFALECYPLDALIGERELVLLPRAGKAPAGPDDGLPPVRYEVVLHGADGARRAFEVPVPVRACEDAAGRPVLRACGWRDGPLATDLETVFDAVLGAVGGAAGSASDGSCPERLTIALDGPFEDEPLSPAGETSSLAEAMHEDLLFAVRERLACAPRPPGRSGPASPGQVVPLVRATGDGPWRVTVTREPVGVRPPPASRRTVEGPVDPDELARADRWLEPGRLSVHLGALGGEGFAGTSCEGRPVPGRLVRARDGGEGLPAVMITAGRHANETTGPVGALRAARELVAEGRRDLAVVPLLNPDGYALFRRLCEDHPGHMHHAARYDARGGDVGDGAPDRERGVLLEARARSGATLHVDCHGYPAHEWTRPFSGYLPRGFEAWSIPRGFFLILRHAPGWRAAAEAVAEACVDALNGFPEVMRVNAEQLKRRARYVPDDGAEVRRGVATFVSEVRDPLVPLTLVTEAPDETVRGERFRVLQEAQRRAVLAAVAAHAPAA